MVGEGPVLLPVEEILLLIGVDSFGGGFFLAASAAAAASKYFILSLRLMVALGSGALRFLIIVKCSLFKLGLNLGQNLVNIFC